MMRLPRVKMILGMLCAISNIAIGEQERAFIIPDHIPTLELPAYDPMVDQTINITTGEWGWIPDQFTFDLSHYQSIKLPNRIFTKHHHGTLFKKVILPKKINPNELALKSDSFFGPASFYLYDTLKKTTTQRASKGKPSSGLNNQPEMFFNKDLLLQIGNNQHEFVLIIHISAQTTQFINLISSQIRLGQYKAMQLNYERLKYISFILLGSYLLASFFNFIMYTQTKRKMSLLIGLFSLSQLIRFSMTENFVLLFWGSSVSENHLIAKAYPYLIFSSFFFLPLLTISIYSSKAFFTLKKHAFPIVLFFATAFLLPSTWIGSILPSIITIIYFLVGLALSVVIITDKKSSFSEKAFNLLSYALPSYTILHDFLVVTDTISAPYLNHWAILIFIIIQTILAGKRYAQAFADNDRLLAEIKEQEKQRTAFFHNTSHELRTPLNGIIGFLDLLQKGRYGSPTEPMQEQFTKIRRLAISLKNQVNLILDLAKSKRGELSLRNSRIDLSEFLRDCESLAAGLKLKHLNSYFRIENQLPTNASFVHDRDQLLSVMRNLLGNAFKFSRTGAENTVSLSVSILADHSLCICVEDTGIGIPEDQLPLIFQEFKQVDSDARRGYEGTGLGLAMVHKIVTLSGGKIEVSSELGQGTRFCLIIPQQPVDSIEKPSQELESLSHSDEELGELISLPKRSVLTQNTESNFSAAVRTVLVVDDNEINCEVVRDILEIYHYKIDIANGGRAALEYLTNHHPDLILLDLMMPEVSGEDVLQAIRADSGLEDIPVILLTARATEDDRIYGLKMGADDYLAKPIIAEELLLRVHNLLSRIELTRLAEHAENREKLALMGELLHELSHEIKNVNSHVIIDQKDSYAKLDLLWASLGLPASTDVHKAATASAQVDFNCRMQQLIVPKDLSEIRRKALRILRTILASSSLSEEELDQVWAELCSFEERQLRITEAMMSLAANVIRMSESSRRTYELIAIILRYGRDSHPGESCNLADAVDETLRLVASKLHKAQIIPKVNIPRDLQVSMAGIELGQIILNLVHNAVDYYTINDIPVKERTLMICSQVDAEGVVSMQVINQGQIPSELRKKIFSRGISSKGEQGSGLGLYISKRIAQRANGDLKLKDDDDKTVFELSVQKVG